MSNEASYYIALHRIAKVFQTAQQVMRDADKIGLSKIEALEYAYDNIQAEAKHAIKGKRRPK